MWDPKDWIALILTLCVFIVFILGLLAPLYEPQGYVESADRATAIKEVLLVIIGAIAGYITGDSKK